jgi:DNA invertase Pin-like site-specific DNA recombinase
MISWENMKKHHRVAPEIREQILKRIKDEGVPVAAKDAGISDATIYSWLGKGVKSMPTIGELVRLKRQNEELLALVGEITLKMSQTQKKN